ncbi:MAG: recombinase family protein [Candidatus Methylopumilus sp.]|jgi:DNA invertase Pin-like site-specific DNA recombinase
MKVGYARVSTLSQSLDAQLASLTDEGCEKIFEEKASGKNADDRKQLQAALEFVRAGDVLIITKLDRLARSMSDLSIIAKQLKAKGVGLKALDQPEIDTTSAIGELLFNVLGAVAAFERSLINERTAEGRLKAIQQGVKFGAKPKLSDEQVKLLKAEAAGWSGSKAALAEKHGISRASLYRVLGDRL